MTDKEKAEALLKALEDIIIHYGMGWELDGVMERAQRAYDAAMASDQTVKR